MSAICIVLYLWFKGVASNVMQRYRPQNQITISIVYSVSVPQNQITISIVYSVSVPLTDIIICRFIIYCHSLTSLA
jgi:hypothetical protein